ncbi:MAG TPA: protein kinase [Terriglobia bacterium]|nr:protein kinase [Terriglobia bacterium]
MMADSPDRYSALGAQESLTGTTVGRFAIGARLGAGGIGEVYRAEDTKLKRSVAIKRLSPKLRADERYRRRFLKEAIQASSLNHPNIAGLYDVLEDGGEILLVMELVEGATLRQRLRDLTGVEVFLPIALQCVQGLAAAHQKGIVHGDIKPENIMLTPSGQVKVLDFGLAKRIVSGETGDTTQISESFGPSLSGTPAYMAPEVLLEKKPDGRADIFALGLVFYEMLGSGRHPFLANSFAGTINRILQENPTPLHKVNPQVPEDLSLIVMKMLAKDPDRRYASAQELLGDLQAIRRSPAIHIPVEVKEKSPRRVRTGVGFGLGLAAVLAALVLIVGSIWLRNRSNLPVRQQQVTGLSLPSQMNLAVMPFTGASNDAKLSALGNGLVESLADKLTQLTGNQSLQVIPARDLRGKGVANLQQARQEFGANLGLRITLQESSDLIRAGYALIDAHTGRALVASQLNVPASDPFDLEDKLADGAIAALQMSLSSEDRRILASHGTNVPAAYVAFLQARGYLQEFKSAASIENAIALFQQALKLDSNYGLAQAGLGEAYWKKYQLTKDNQWSQLAQSACADAVAARNAGAEGHICLGQVADGIGNYQDAVEQYQRAIELEPTSDDALAGLAEAYQQSGKPDDVEKIYRRAISLRPQYSEPYDRLGALYLHRSDYGQAEQMFQKVADLTPDSFRGFANLGAADLDQGHYQDAIKPLEQSLAMRPTADTYSKIAAAYFHLQNYGEAARNYLEATKLNDRDYALWGNLAEANFYAGKRSEAMEAYRKAMSLANGQLQVNSRDAQVLSALANYYSMLGDRKDALARLDQSLQYSGGDKNLLFNAALIYNQLGETGSALDWLQKSLQEGYSKELIKGAPALENLRKNPRYVELIGN